MELDIYDANATISDICHRYWETDANRHFKNKVAAIATEFELSTHQVQKIVKSSCTAFSSETQCHVCQEPYAYKNRQDYSALKEGQLWMCAECAEKSEEREKRDKINALTLEFEARQKSAPRIENMSLRQWVLLTAFIDYAIAEDLSYLHPLNSPHNVDLSPTYTFSLEILSELYEDKLIAIHPNSPDDTITMRGKTGFAYYSSEVLWLLPSSNPQHEPIDFINSLSEKIANLNGSPLTDDIVMLCHELALNECLAYLEHVLNEVKLPFSAGDRINGVLNNAVVSFSVAQIYSFIWRAGKDAAAFYLKGAKSKQHAANIVAGNIERQVENALANHWEVKPYGRIKAIPQSLVSQVLFNKLLKIEEGGFNHSLGAMFVEIDKRYADAE